MHAPFFSYLKIPFVLGHNGEDGTFLATVRTSGLNNLNICLRVPMLKLTLQAFIQLLAAFLFTFASTAYIKNTFRRAGKIFHEWLVSNTKITFESRLMQGLDKEVRQSPY
jgi:hypothetical protein